MNLVRVMLYRQPFRSSDVLLLTSTSKGTSRNEAVQLLVLVESVERDPASRDQKVVQALVNMTPKQSGKPRHRAPDVFVNIY